MKSNSKVRLFALTAVVSVMMFPAPAISLEGYGQISLNNQSSSVADLYVDGAYRCRALVGLFCTTQVRVGTHHLQARLTDGRTTSQPDVTVAQGEVRTFTIQDR